MEFKHPKLPGLLIPGRLARPVQMHLDGELIRQPDDSLDRDIKSDIAAQERDAVIAVSYKVGVDNVHWTEDSGLERSEEHTSELQSRFDLVCRLLLEKKKHKPQTQIQ